ncbi:ankyrin repeat domain-containing protein [Flavobacterium sp.]|jgi:hypothetical protein|uniref:ankyrin repeat domain-containing protein n=1 Tax=Flavobacterium sp. TaxID=239 RepID=UPI0037C11BE1
MKNKKTIVFASIVLLVFIGYKYYSTKQKEEWVTENPATKYSEKREKAVWGGVLRGNDEQLFYGTPLYDAAKAMSGISYFRNDDEIEELINQIPKDYINYQEAKYGMTIGHFALRTYNYKALRQLADRALNPNILDVYGDAIIIKINSSTYSYKLPESSQTLQHLIEKGANVNLYSQNGQMPTPLISAANGGNLEHIKILVAAGANPHFLGDFNSPFRSPLSTALVNRRMEIINYFIFGQKVDFRTLKYPDYSKFHPGEYEILHNLRELFFKLDSKEYKEKMRLVAYLKTQGLDYWKTPIQKRHIANPNYTAEYLSKY